VPATYSVLVAGRSTSGSPAVGVVVAGLLPGQYDVTIRVARNCQVDGENPRAATVVAGQTTAVAFSVTCLAATGTLRVTTVTTGVDLDQDGYTIRVEGSTVEGKPYQQSWRLGANGVQTISGVPVGNDKVTLTGMSINCDPTQESQRMLTM